MSHSGHPETLDPHTVRALIDELHAAVRENRAAVNTLTAEFGNWRKEPRLRTIIDSMQFELDRNRQAIHELAAEVTNLREELRNVKTSTSGASQ